MHFLKIFFDIIFVVCVICICQVFAATSGFQAPQHIPYHLSLQFQGFKHFCSAALSIWPNPDFWGPSTNLPSPFKQTQIGITAASCVWHNIRPIFAIGGRTDHTKLEPGRQIRAVTEVIRNSNFKWKGTFDNIAILLFEHPFDITSPNTKVMPIAYEIDNTTSDDDYLEDDPPTRNDHVWVTGWRFMYPGVTKQTTNQLQVFQSTITGYKECRDSYPSGNYRVGGSLRCYEPPNTIGAGNCFGDAGAPVVNYDPQNPADVSNPGHKLIGVASIGHECSIKNKGSIFTVLRYYTTTISVDPWFRKMLNERTVPLGHTTW